MSIRRFTQRVEPRLSAVLDALQDASMGPAFKDRALEIATSGAFEDPIDHGIALRSHLWLLERAAAEGLPLTAAGYLKPADVKAFAEVLPTMRDWIFPVTVEIHAQPVLYFREYLGHVGLLRKFKGTLRATRAAKAGIAAPGVLWEHLAATLIPGASSFVESAGVVILVHMGTSEGRIDVNVVARTMTELGWSHSTGEEVDPGDVYPVWNDLWAALGNVGQLPTQAGSLDRRLGRDAVGLIRDALFTNYETILS